MQNEGEQGRQWLMDKFFSLLPLGGLSYSVIYKTLPQNPVISFM